jgi:hypothetical protein
MLPQQSLFFLKRLVDAEMADLAAVSGFILFIGSGTENGRHLTNSAPEGTCRLSDRFQSK